MHRAVRFFIFLIVFSAFIALGHRAKASEIEVEGTFSSEFQVLELRSDPLSGFIADFSDKSEESNLISVSLQEDLAKRVQAEMISDFEMASILDDLSTKDGAVYKLPNVDEMKLSLGFPQETVFHSSDYLELVKVHVQVMLGISPLASAYLVSWLGVGATSEF